MDPIAGATEAVNTSVAVRVLYSWLFNGAKVNFEDLLRECFWVAEVPVPTMAQVLVFIRCFKNEPTVTLFVDEPMRCKQVGVGTESKGVLVLSHLGSMMQTDQSLHVMFSTLSQQMMVDAKSGSGMDLIPLMATPLDQAQSVSICTALFGTEPRSRVHKQLLAAAGGHCRSLEVVLSVLRQHWECDASYECLLKIATNFQMSTVMPDSSRALRKLLELAILQKTVPVTYLLNPEPEEATRYTVRDAIAMGQLQQPLKDDTLEITPYIPAIMLLRIAKAIGESEPAILQAVSTIARCGSQEEWGTGKPFEQLVAAFEALLTNFLPAATTLAVRYKPAFDVAVKAGLPIYQHVDLGATYIWRGVRVFASRTPAGNQTDEQLAAASGNAPSDVAVDDPTWVRNYIVLVGAGSPGFDAMTLVQCAGDVAEAHPYHLMCIEARFSARDSAGVLVKVREKTELTARMFKAAKDSTAAEAKDSSETDKYRILKTLLQHTGGSPPTLLFYTLRPFEDPESGTIVFDRTSTEALLGKSIMRLLDALYL